MAIGPGFWLAPETGEVWRVGRHECWLKDLANHRAAKLPQVAIDALGTLDPATDADEIRMIGVRAGLIRVRDYGNRLSIQFFASRKRVPAVLERISKSLPKLFSGIEHFLTLHNLCDDSSASIWSREFVDQVGTGRDVMQPRPSDAEWINDIPYSQELNAKVDSLLHDTDRTEFSSESPDT